MFLNSENTKINSFLLRENMQNLSKAFLELLAANVILDKKELKIMSKFVRNNNSQDLRKKFLEMFSRFEIDIELDYGKKSSNLRVKKYRDNIKLKGYKNLSLQLPPDEYKKLKDLKISKQMTYSELIIFLMDR